MATILVIHDYEAFREAIAYCLPKFGHEAIVVADHAAGVRVALRRPVDMVLTDTGGTNGAGFAICSAFKSDERLRHLPFLLMVDQVTPAVVAQARAVGAECVLPKIFEWPVFLDAVARLLPERVAAVGEAHRAGAVEEERPILQFEVPVHGKNASGVFPVACRQE